MKTLGPDNWEMVDCKHMWEGKKTFHVLFYSATYNCKMPAYFSVVNSRAVERNTIIHSQALKLISIKLFVPIFVLHIQPEFFC